MSYMVERYDNLSWDEYAYLLILSSKHIKAAAIYSLAGRQLATTSEFLKLDSNQLDKVLMAFISSPTDCAKLELNVADETFKIRLNDRHRGLLTRAEESGATLSVCKTLKLLLFGLAEPQMDADKANYQIMKLGDYFINMGM